MTNESDKATQAMDNLFPAMAKMGRAYRAWKAGSEAPGDPHKEWVDAEKMKPNEIVQHTVMVKVADGEVGLGKWTPRRNENGVKNSWQVQLFYSPYYCTERGVTHWRYIPEDDNG